MSDKDKEPKETDSMITALFISQAPSMGAPQKEFASRSLSTISKEKSTSSNDH